MSLFKDLRNELEATELKPISIEIGDQQLIRISIAVAIMAAIIFLMKAVLMSATK